MLPLAKPNFLFNCIVAFAGFYLWTFRPLRALQAGGHLYFLKNLQLSVASSSFSRFGYKPILALWKKQCNKLSPRQKQTAYKQNTISSINNCHAKQKTPKEYLSVFLFIFTNVGISSLRFGSLFIKNTNPVWVC